MAAALDDVSALRVSLGLPAATADATLQQTLTDAAPAATALSSTSDVDAPSSCNICGEVQPTTGEGEVSGPKLLVLYWPDGWTARQIVDANPRHAMALLAGGGVQVAEAMSPAGYRLVAFAPISSGQSAIRRWPQTGLFDPERPNTVAFWTEAAGDVTISDTRGPVLQNDPTSATYAGIYEISPRRTNGDPLGWDRTYTIRVGGSTLSFTTSPRPATYQQPVRFTRRVNAAQRRLILAAIRRSPALVRRQWQDIGGALTVTVGRRNMGASTASIGPAGLRITFNPNHLIDSSMGRFIILHEFGHIVDFAGIASSYDSQWEAEIVKRPGYFCRGNAIGGNAQSCPSVSEWWAEQYAHWATGITKPMSGYGTRSVYTRKAFAAKINAWYTLAPNGLQSS